MKTKKFTSVVIDTPPEEPEDLNSYWGYSELNPQIPPIDQTLKDMFNSMTREEREKALGEDRLIKAAESLIKNK